MPHLQLQRKKNLSAFRKVAIGTWETTYDPSVYGTLTIRMEKAIDYLKEFRRITGKRLTFSHMMAAIRRRIPRLAELVVDAIIIEDSLSSFRSVIQSVAERAANDLPHLPVQQLVDRIISCEEAMPTAIGLPVAIPHAYHSAVDRPRCYVANVIHGTAAQTGEGPSQLVFLVLSPLGEGEVHLASLAAIAKLANEPRYVAPLAKQDSASLLLHRLRERC